MQAEAEHTRTQAALVLVDIDDYQRINRALGYDAGDDMLRETARRIQHAAGHGEIVARDRERRVRRAGARRHDGGSAPRTSAGAC